nr:MAG: hypothetical protein 1 [Leviviridae sp.]
MGTPRSRSRELTLHTPGFYQTGYYPGGNWTPIGGPVGGSGIANIGETCNDTLGPGPPYVEPHGLTLIKRKVVPLKFSGEARLSSTNVRRHTNYNPQNFTGYIYVSEPGPTDWNYWKAKAMATINPYRPQVDLPLFLFEFREFPRLLRGLGLVLSGRYKASDVAGGYLAYNFGWKPLISDLAALIDLGGSIAKARRDLQNAAQGGRVSRSLGSMSSHSLLSPYQYALGTAGTYTLSRIQNTTVKGWCTARVHLTEPLPTAGDELQELFKRTAFGLNLRPAMLWDAIPWSWLIDYFTNIGDLMEARGGYSLWRFTELFVMVKTSRSVKIGGALNSVGSMTYTGGEMNYTRKERSYVGSNPNVGLGLSPLLSDYQAGILGSLLTAAALRGRR